MDSSQRQSWTALPELQPPDDAESIRRTFSGYRQAIGQMNQPQLLEELTRINAALQEQSRLAMTEALTRPLSESLANLDRLVLRSTPTPLTQPRPKDRGVPPSPTSQPLDRPDPRYGSTGRRLAAKLAAAGARRIGGRG